jgi:hypothetical protein
MLTMPDTLRDRIAAVLYGNLRRQQGIDRPDRFLDWIDTSELAVAVIEALGLRQEYDPYSEPESSRYRYVTEWVPES